MFPVIEDAVRRGQDELIYKLISSNRVSAEDFIADGFRTSEEIDQILKKYGQKDKENPDK